MVETARAAGMYLFGPNCMGLYAPRTGLSFFPGLSRTPGHLGLISHSGSLGNILGRLAEDRGLAFSKVVSLGNEADLNSADLLAYLAEDEETRVIGGYLEGIQNGPYFLRALKRAAANKPVVLWKVGLTPEGGRAAASHTGALAGSRGHLARRDQPVQRGVRGRMGPVAGNHDGFFIFFLPPREGGWLSFPARAVWPFPRPKLWAAGACGWLN